MKIPVKINHNKVMVVLNGLLIIGLIFSKPLISIAIILLIINWLIEGNIKRKWQHFLHDKIALSLVGIFLLHIVGLLVTSDFNYAFSDLRIKLPLLILPIIYSGNNSFTEKQLYFLFNILIFSIAIATLFDFLIYLKIIPGKTPGYDFRKISFFMSNVRFSLLICITILIIAANWRKHLTWLKIIMVALIIWLGFFLFIIQSATAMIVIIIIGTVYFIRAAVRAKSKLRKLLFLCCFILIPTITTLLLVQSVNNYNKVNEIEKTPLSHYSALNNPYFHDTTNTILENGYYVWRNLAFDELKCAWNKRSKIKYGVPDSNGRIIDGLVIRYLTSKGLKKDAAGVESLSEKDIHLIEHGVANCTTPYKWGLQKRIDDVLFELSVYANGGNPSGNSVTQRLEFWKAAIWIIKQNPLTGVGTGDLRLEYENAYSQMNSPLDQTHRLRAHNQYLTMGVTFGIPGLIIFIILFFIPVIKNNNYKHSLYYMFFLVQFISFFAEDALETQVGVTIFAYFSCLFLFVWIPLMNNKLHSKSDSL